MNDLIIERVTGWPDGNLVKTKLNELIDAHNALVRSLNPVAVPPKPVEAQRKPTIVPKKHENNPCDLYDWLVAIGYRCNCIFDNPIPHPKCKYKLICSECHKPYLEKDET